MKQDKGKIARLQELMKKDLEVLSRAVVFIFENQTPEEQTVGATVEDNGIGFSGTDSAYLTSAAKRVLSGRPITVNMKPYVEKYMMKYAGQLLKHGFEFEESNDVSFEAFDEMCKRITGVGALSVSKVLNLATQNFIQETASMTGISEEDLLLINRKTKLVLDTVQ